MRNRENVKDTESNWLLRREGNNGQDTETGRRVTDGKALPSCDLFRFSRRSGQTVPAPHNAMIKSQNLKYSFY